MLITRRVIIAFICTLTAICFTFNVAQVSAVYIPTAIQAVVVVKKTDETTGETLTGAEFTVYSEDGSVSEELKQPMYSDGRYVCTVPYDADNPVKYFIKETKAPEGYILDETPKEITFSEVQEGETVETIGTFLNITGYLNFNGYRVSITEPEFTEEDIEKINNEKAAAESSGLAYCENKTFALTKEAKETLQNSGIERIVDNYGYEIFPNISADSFTIVKNAQNIYGSDYEYVVPGIDLSFLPKRIWNWWEEGYAEDAPHTYWWNITTKKGLTYKLTTYGVISDYFVDSSKPNFDIYKAFEDYMTYLPPIRYGTGETVFTVSASSNEENTLKNFFYETPISNSKTMRQPNMKNEYMTSQGTNSRSPYDETLLPIYKSEINFTNKVIIQEPSKVDLKLIKTWDDDSNKAQVRPSTDDFISQINLLAGGEVINISDIPGATITCVDNSDNTYIVEIKNLPATNSGGAEITYSLTEKSIPNYRNGEIKAKESGGLDNNQIEENTNLVYKYVVTNKYEEPEIPTEPTTPTEPEQPTDPTTPTEPTEPELPTESTIPTEPTTPTKPDTPTDPTSSIDSSEPTNSTDNNIKVEDKKVVTNDVTGSSPLSSVNDGVKTGDSNSLIPWIILCTLSVIIGTCLMTRRKKH